MKYISTVFLFLFCISSLRAQEKQYPHRAIVGGVVEYTAAGTLAGGYAGYNLTRHWILGAYYEDRLGKFESEFNNDYYLFGGFLNYVIVRENRLDLSVMGRVGLKSERFVVIAPAIVMGYRINRFLEANVVGSIRSQFPSIGFSLFTNFNFKK